MLKKIFLINKLFISDGNQELQTMCYGSQDERDNAWNELIETHNEMIKNSFCDEEHPTLESLNDDYEYNYGDNELEFYSRIDKEMHHDYFCKDIDEINVTCDVYVVIEDSMYDDEPSSDYKVFGTLEEAKAHFNNLKQKFINDMGDQLTTTKDTDNGDDDRDENYDDCYDEGNYIVEETEMAYSCYRDGYYNSDHYNIDIIFKTL